MSNPTVENVTTIIGLEVHVQLTTNSKLFCRCQPIFGEAPNTRTCPVCTGMPGTLPVLNQHALELSIKTGLALNCSIGNLTKWDRKNYFYPDLPKGYQISQFDLPVASEGWLEISHPKNEFEPRKVGIIRAHLEEDAGKSMHDETAGVADSKIDLNRCGTPLLEIVSHPDMRSPAEARAYLNELKLTLSYLGVSDCNMQEGSLRVDANVNLHLESAGQTIATPIVEVKNMNSFRAVERALVFEKQRQLQQWKKTGQVKGDVPKQTRGWVDESQSTIELRSKEESSDYRYFPDPDLVTVTISNEQIESAKSSLGRLPTDVRAELQSKYNLNQYDADVIANQGLSLFDYFVETANATGNSKQTANWITQNVMRVLNDQQISIQEFPINSERLSGILQAINDGKLDNSRAKEVFEAMLTSSLSAEETMKELGIEQVDTGALEELCRDLLEKNPQVIEQFNAGKQQAVGALIGQAKKINPNVNPGMIRKMLVEMIQKQNA